MAIKEDELEMKNLWEDITGWYLENAARRLETLGKPATPELLEKVERELVVKFPNDLRASLSIYDGGLDVDGYVTLSAESLLELWHQMEKNRVRGVYEKVETRPEGEGVLLEGWWQPGWIPFAQESGGDFLCTDTTPVGQGAIGQVILIGEEGPVPTRDRSYLSWLKRFRDDLINGRMSVDPEGFVRSRDRPFM